jgi:alpha-beta hydrolase superfamily lysophospholipase
MSVNRNLSSIQRIDLRTKVEEVSSLGSDQAVASWLFLPPPELVHADSRLLVCLPGGSYDKRYYHLTIPGFPEYSMAEHLACFGHFVLAVDPLGIGESTRPHIPSDLTPEAVAAAIHYVTTSVLASLRDGSAYPSIPPRPRLESVGIGHSMGGMLTVIQQAIFQTHKQIVILGKSVQHQDRKDFPGPMRDGTFGDVNDYFMQDRVGLRRVYFWEDVPPEVIAANDAAVVPLPLALANRSIAADVASVEASEIDVPVFLGVGERDTVPDPLAEALMYPNSHDITLFLLAESAHCHNFASGRKQLWNRIAAWIPTVQVDDRRTPSAVSPKE